MFKRKKTYCIRWAWVTGTVYQEIVLAKDIAHAWQELKKEHPSAVYCFSITEIKKDEFKENDI